MAEDDIQPIAELYEKVFGGSTRTSTQGLQSYLADILFRNPWYDGALPSLVYEDHKGKIAGFLGVMPRRMSINGRRIRVAVSHTFMVDPGSRSTLAGVQLLKAFFAGPQDLSIAEGNDLSRKIWEGLGGTTELLYNMCWTRLLRPAGYALSFVERRKPSVPLLFALRPSCRVVDVIAAQLPWSPFRPLKPQAGGEDLEVESLLSCLSTFASSRSLWPEYDARSLSWLFDMVARKEAPNSLRKVIVRSTENATLGWYVYYPNPKGVSEVVQIMARDASINEVLDHLFYDAWQHGVVMLSGRIDPKFMRALSRKYCLFDCSGSWMLVHAHNPELLQALHRGDAFLTRLESEWWITFGFRHEER